MTQNTSQQRPSSRASTWTRVQKLPRSAIVWLTLSLLLLFVPLVQVLGYESAMAINVLVVFLGGPMLFGRDASKPVWTRFWRRTARLSAWSTLSAALLVANMLRIPNCDLGSGLVLWVVFGLGGIPLVVALTLFCERITSRTFSFYACYFSIIAVSLFGSVAWLALQPPLVVYDVFTGFWAVSIYDEALTSWQTHVPYRAMTWVGAALICNALAFEETPSRYRAAWVAVLAVALGWFIVASDDLHITRSRAYAERLLGAQVETEHFIIVYEAGAFSKRQVVELIADHERQYDELVAFWGVEPAQKMRSYIYASSDTRADAMGVYSTMIARVWLNEMHLVWRGFGDPLLKHEMSHLMLREHGRGPLRLSSRSGLLPAMGLVEGAASAAAWEVDDLDDHGWSAALLATGQMKDVARMLGASSFWSQPSRLSYTVWSSFSRWLIEEKGAETFLDAYRDANFERAYGVPLRTLTDGWIAFLETIDLDAAQRAAAQMRFERPALFQRMCGRAIATREHDARAAIRHRDRSAADASIAWLERHSAHDPYLQLRVADLWARTGEVSAAERMAHSVLSHAEEGPELAQQARLMLADLAWMDDDVTAALTWLSRLRAHPHTRAVARALWVRESLIKQRATSPRAYQAGKRYLAAPWEYDGLTLRIDLIASAFEENSAAAAWLAYRVSAQQTEAEATPLLADILAMGVIPDAVTARFHQDRLAWATRRADRTPCRDAWIEDFSSSKASNAVSGDIELLIERCRVSGRYLDAARRVVE